MTTPITFMGAPATFDQYVARREAAARARQARGARPHDSDECTSCGRTRELLTRDGYCGECLREAFGHDRAEANVVDVAVGGVVSALLDAEIPEEQILRAVHRAISANHEGELEDALSRVAA